MHRREMSPYSFELCQGNLTGCISHSSVISGYLLKSMNVNTVLLLPSTLSLLVKTKREKLGAGKAE